MAGTSFPINREATAKALGFDGVCENSLDAVSDRDFAIEFCACASLTMTHLSRFCEELIIWMNPRFGFVTLADRFCTGSSIMPQKKNPDVPELIRGKTGRVNGHLVALLTLMKGQPLAYNKDTQEDKEGLFDSIDTMENLLPALDETLISAKFNGAHMAEGLAGDFSTATDMADALAAAGIPFREAHGIVAGLVRQCLESGRTLEDLGQEELALVHAALAGLDLSPAASAERRKSAGGTAKSEVLKQIEAAKSCH